MEKIDRIEREIVVSASTGTGVGRLDGTRRSLPGGSATRPRSTFAPVEQLVSGGKATGIVSTPSSKQWIRRTRFAYRWAVESDTPLEEAPSTLVEFTLEPGGNGTIVRLVESGFAALPDDQYEETIGGNKRGLDLRAW